MYNAYSVRTTATSTWNMIEIISCSHLQNVLLNSAIRREKTEVLEALLELILTSTFLSSLRGTRDASEIG